MTTHQTPTHLIGRARAMKPEQINLLSILYRSYVPATVASKMLNTSNITVSKYYNHFRMDSMKRFELQDFVQLLETLDVYASSDLQENTANGF